MAAANIRGLGLWSGLTLNNRIHGVAKGGTYAQEHNMTAA